MAARSLLEAPTVLVQMPTGSGKTVVATNICKLFEPVLWIAHRRELLDQANQALTLAKVKHKLLSSAAVDIPTKEYNLVVYDEYHHSAANSCKKLLDALNYKKLLAITATPDRLDNKLVHFDRAIVPTTYEELIKQGYLSQIRLWHVRSDDDHISMLINWLHSHRGTGQTIFFAKDLEEAEHIHRNIKIKSAVMKGSHATRRRYISDFKNKRIQCLVSCLILTEGVDLPSCKTVILGRRTNSKTLMSQMIGRAVRIHGDKKHCNIVEPAKMWSKRYVSAADIISPNKRFVSTLVSKKWRTEKI